MWPEHHYHVSPRSAAYNGASGCQLLLKDMGPALVSGRQQQTHDSGSYVQGLCEATACALSQSMFQCLCAMQIVSPTILPFTVERENMLLDATVSVQRRLPHSNAYFRVSHAKSSLKEHTLWVTLVINRQSFKHGAGHLTYKQVSAGNLRAVTAAHKYWAVA